MATKKAAAKKSSARSATTKKQPSKRAPAKKVAAKKSGETNASGSQDPAAGQRRGRSAPRAAATRRPSGLRLAADAAQELGDLTGRDVEGVTGVERRDDGWTVYVEVLEVSRVPTTTDVLAVYEVTLDESGEIEGYRRVQRYVRGNAGEDGGR